MPLTTSYRLMIADKIIATGRHLESGRLSPARVLRRLNSIATDIERNDQCPLPSPDPSQADAPSAPSSTEA